MLPARSLQSLHVPACTASTRSYPLDPQFAGLHPEASHRRTRGRTASQQHCRASDQAAEGFLQRQSISAAEPEYFRCCICFDTNFTTRGKLAHHLLRHAEFSEEAGSTGSSICPYCGAAGYARAHLAQHLQTCSCMGRVLVPPDKLHMLSQEHLDQDPRYAALLHGEAPAGRIVVRPMHPSHIFEAAYLTTEAFLVDKEPPGFKWTLQELQRDVHRYMMDPSPVTQRQVSMEPDPRWEPPWDSSAHTAKDRAEAFRIAQLNAWGRWVWLAAELIPRDKWELAPGQTSRVAGAIAVMLHSRSASLRKLEPLTKQAPELMLDTALWVENQPPPNLPHQRAAFMWWTGTSSRYRRQGIAQLLLAAAEKVAANAGFTHAYVQANTRQRDAHSPLGAWFNKEYRAAKALYARAGYAEYIHPAPFLRARTDGSVWSGKAFGAGGNVVAEVVFNTSITGYQEIMTDPSYQGQFVVFTHPHIGNTGINLDDMESKKAHLSGIVVRDLSCIVSNYRSAMSLAEYCKQQGVLGIADVDTRAITRRLRDTGALNGIITTDASISDDQLVRQAKEWSILGKDLVAEVTCAEPYEWTDDTEDEWEFSPDVLATNGLEPLHVVAYDFGCKHNILRRLASYGCKVTVVPASYPADKALAISSDGIFLSNGPGDPSALPYAVETVKQLLGKKPIFGICMGHQILGQALGSTTFKLKFGHHGGNHPIRFSPSGRIEVSAQNHNYAVNPDSLPKNVEVTHINLNDGTCAGIKSSDLKLLGIQYHPEASPGPHDGDVSFQAFVDMMRAERASRPGATSETGLPMVGV
ncbi:hypothetical protein WJX73_004577 [Symbiochloris irregularis]|uniref:Carbamoyl phosphate synthase small chain, chloroplastic n=1 Tax=Symbiochloris irregularis TaxID=706552 RepID=A0AAW1P7K1_9CHLO